MGANIFRSHAAAITYLKNSLSLTVESSCDAIIPQKQPPKGEAPETQLYRQYKNEV